MNFHNTFSVNAPVDDVWEAILDVERAASCMPGARILESEGPSDEDSPDEHRAAITVELGALSVTYTGEVEIVEADAGVRRAVISARANEALDRSAAYATVEIRLSPRDGTTHGTVHTDLAISGRAAATGQGTLGSTAARLIETFAANLSNLLASGSGSGAGESPSFGAPGPVGPWASRFGAPEEPGATEPGAQEPAPPEPEPATPPPPPWWQTEPEPAAEVEPPPPSPWATEPAAEATPPEEEPLPASPWATEPAAEAPPLEEAAADAEAAPLDAAAAADAETGPLDEEPAAPEAEATPEAEAEATPEAEAEAEAAPPEPDVPAPFWARSAQTEEPTRPLWADPATVRGTPPEPPAPEPEPEPAALVGDPGAAPPEAGDPGAAPSPSGAASPPPPPPRPQSGPLPIPSVARGGLPEQLRNPKVLAVAGTAALLLVMRRRRRRRY
jgi:carbon monoxide dehydrogenase subunit G